LKTSLLLFAFGLGWVATTIPASLVAQDEIPEDTTMENFELSFFPGVQLRGEDSAIQILRLGLYNRNVSVQGLDIGIVNQTTGGISKGLQLGVVGFVEGDFSGWQSNAVNIVGGEFNGLQGPGVLYNEMTSGEAVQIGVFNRARDISGFQLGIVNWAENMHGIQIGLVNIISGKESLQFLPIVNWSF
jgi:hypothetical protein